MISTINPEPQCNFWQQLQTKVAEIEGRTRDKAQRIEQIMNREESKKRNKRITRFQLEQNWHRTIEQNRNITNRIKYLQQQQQRQHRTLQLTKYKYQKIRQIRSRSIQEREELRKKLMARRAEIDRQINFKANRVREERAKTSHSIQRVRIQNQIQAKTVREMIEEDQEIIKKSKEEELKNKQKIVQKAHQLNQISKSTLSKMQEQRIELGRINHRSYLKSKLQRNIQQSRRNSILRQKLAESLASAKGGGQDEQLSQMRDIQSCMATPRSKQLKLFNSN